MSGVTGSQESHAVYTSIRQSLGHLPRETAFPNLTPAYGTLDKQYVERINVPPGCHPHWTQYYGPSDWANNAEIYRLNSIHADVSDPSPGIRSPFPRLTATAVAEWVGVGGQLVMRRTAQTLSLPVVNGQIAADDEAYRRDNTARRQAEAQNVRPSRLEIFSRTDAVLAHLSARFDSFHETKKNHKP